MPTSAQYRRPGFCMAMMTSRSILRRATDAGCAALEVATALCSMFAVPLPVLGQVEHAGARAQLFQDAARARVFRPLVHFRILVEQVAEHDGLARARLR